MLFEESIMKVETRIGILLLFGLAIATVYAVETKVGEFKNLQHGIGGTVYIVDENTLLIKGFTYDGAGPDAFFWAGSEGDPSTVGTILPYPYEGKFYDYTDKSAPIIKGRFNGNLDITLKTPSTLKTSQIKWLSVWCRKFTVDFGHLYFPDMKDENKNSESQPEPETEPEQSGKASSCKYKLLTALSNCLLTWAILLVV